MEIHEKRYIGCTGKEDCIICNRVSQPGYELVRLNLSLDRISIVSKELLPIQTPISIPQEVKELLERVSTYPNSIPEKKIPLRVVKSVFTCIHGGESSSNKAMCPSCGGRRIQLKIFKCNIYTSCTIDRQVEGIMCCLKCNDYVSK